MNCTKRKSRLAAGHRLWSWLVPALVLLSGSTSLSIQDDLPPLEEPPAWDQYWEQESMDGQPLNWKLTTMGGTQFWTDLRHRSGWRIQRHYATGHCRLLDPNDVRRAWGTLEQCEASLAALIETEPVPPNSKTVVILVHGLARTRGCWVPMTRCVQEHTRWQVIDFTYASSRKPVSDHAQALRQVIETLGPEVKQIHFAGHSLGNIVVRHYLADTTSTDNLRQGDPRIGRIVMIGPPNHGSKMARVLQPTGVFSFVTGRSGVELGKDWEQLEGKLAVPKCEFGIIAGGSKENGQGYNPLLSGSGDMTVSLEEAKLAGASDLMVHPLFHATMMKQSEVCAATVRFLQTGCFSESGTRNPIPAGPPGPGK